MVALLLIGHFKNTCDDDGDDDDDDRKFNSRQSQASNFAPGSQFAGLVYDYKVKQRGALWQIRWMEILTPCFSMALTSIGYCHRHALYGPAVGKHDVHKNGGI